MQAQNTAPQRLFVVNGIFSFIHALCAKKTDKADRIFVLVLFQYDAAQNEVTARKIRQLRPNAEVRFLNEPKAYIKTLGDRDWLRGFCGDVTELRMFYTHNHWLHNALFGAYPKAKIVLFEEGTASFYPGLWEGFSPSATARIERVCINEYLGVFKPLDSRDHPEQFKTPKAEHQRGFLSQLPDSAVPLPSLERPAIVLVEQYFHKKGKDISFDEVVALYERAVRQILAKGYDILYKGHPRENFGIWEALSGRLDRAALARVKMVPREVEVLEAVIERIAPVAVVGVNSTSQLVCPHLFDVPSFRIRTNMPIRMSQSIEIERRGLVCNQLAQDAIFPPLDALPEAGEADQARAVFRGYMVNAVPNTEQPLIAELAKQNFQPGLSALIAAITDEATAAVSFDVFDTLVWRPGLVPSDMLVLLDKAFSADLGGFLRFSVLRGSLFAGMRQRDRRAGCEREEYPLSALYEFAGSAYQLPKALTDRMLEAEIALERQMLQPRRTGMALMELAKAYGKRVVLTSDTYFTAAELSDLLAPLLPLAPDLTISSLDEGVTKRTGRLFEVLLARLDLPPEAIVHLGDNKQGDVDQPIAYGLRAFHFPAFHDILRKHRIWQAWEGQRLEAGAKLVLGLFAGRFFDNPFALHREDSNFDMSPYWLGYGAVGPMMLGWARWTLQEALERGHDKLMFIARDGWVPLQIAQRLQELLPRYAGISCDYVFASRKAYMPVYQKAAHDVAFTRFAHGLDPATNSVERALATRFGRAVLDRFGPLFREAGFDDLTKPIRRERMELFNETLASIAGEIAQMQAGAQDEVRAYFKSAIGEARAPALVDIGYSGSSQRAFMLATDRRVDGYYLTIMEHNVEYSAVLEYGAYDYSREPAFFRNGAFVEYLITPTGLPECVGYRTERPGKTVPVFGGTKAADPVSDAIHAGIEAFLLDVFALFGAQIDALETRPANAVRMLASFVTAPGKGDAAMFDRLEHEDEIGAARPNLLEYWPAGKAALKS